MAAWDCQRPATHPEAATQLNQKSRYHAPHTVTSSAPRSTAISATGAVNSLLRPRGKALVRVAPSSVHFAPRMDTPRHASVRANTDSFCARPAGPVTSRGTATAPSTTTVAQLSPSFIPARTPRSAA